MGSLSSNPDVSVCCMQYSPVYIKKKIVANYSLAIMGYLRLGYFDDIITKLQVANTAVGHSLRRNYYYCG